MLTRVKFENGTDRIFPFHRSEHCSVFLSFRGQKASSVLVVGRVAQESPHGLKVPGSGSDRDIGRDFGTIGVIAKTVCFFFQNMTKIRQILNTEIGP